MSFPFIYIFFISDAKFPVVPFYETLSIADYVDMKGNSITCPSGSGDAMPTSGNIMLR